MLNRSGMIGLCCTAANKDPAKPIIDAIAEQLENTGARKMLVFQCFEDMYMNTPTDIGGASVYKLINYDMLDAMVIVPFSMHDHAVIEQVVQECLKHDVPLISIDTEIPGAFNVQFGYGEAFGAIVKHVLDVHGCRRIKLVSGPADNPFSQQRVDCCREIMQQHGLTLSDSDIMCGEFWETPTYRAMDRFFESGEPLPDAFICCNDAMAMAVCLKLTEHGYSVPGDVIVTGFDGINMERYHTPRLTTASRDHSQLARTVLGIIERICSEPGLKPCNTELRYDPVFSESCGCGTGKRSDPNRMLADIMADYKNALNYEEYVNRMENAIAADPTPGNVHDVLKKYCPGNAMICLTEELNRYFHGQDDVLPAFNGFGEMRVFLSTFEGRSDEGTVFPAARLIPQLENSFGANNTLFIIPLHFQDTVHGYFITHYVLDEHHSERLYTFCTSLDRCLETMCSYEHMSILNRRLEFMFTHDQLTKIYNRYGFYSGFRNGCASVGGDREVFIVSIDLNDMKYINDNYGHSAGDDALCITAAALTRAAEQCGGDVICSRFGGDEFVAAKVCEGSAKEQADRFRAGFADSLAELNSKSGRPLTVKVSIGTYLASLDGVESIDELIELADRLMYSDKAKHKRHPRN